MGDSDHVVNTPFTRLSQGNGRGGDFTAWGREAFGSVTMDGDAIYGQGGYPPGGEDGWVNFP